LIRCNFCLCS